MASLAFAVVGWISGLVATDLAAQALHDIPFRPLVGTCPACGQHRGWQRYRCPHCGQSINQGALISLVTAAVAVGFYSTLGWSWLLVPFILFLTLTAALGTTDIRAMRIVNRLNIPGSAVVVAVLSLVALLGEQYNPLLRGLAGGGAYFAGALLLFIVVRGNGFGAGDVKLAPVLGVFTAFLGWDTLGTALFGTAVIGGVVAVFALLFMAAKRDTELPYGPAMILGAWLAIVLADQVLVL